MAYDKEALCSAENSTMEYNYWELNQGPEANRVLPVLPEQEQRPEGLATPNSYLYDPYRKKLEQHSTHNAPGKPPENNYVLNLSDRALTPRELELLSLRLKFIPSTHKIHKKHIYHALNQLIRIILLYDFFHNTNKPIASHKLFRKPSYWNLHLKIYHKAPGN